MTTMLYKYDNQGDTIVQVNSVSDYQTFKTIITEDIDSALSDGYFLTAKEAILATQVTPEAEVISNDVTTEIQLAQRGRPKK
jgi:uncharacterized protein YaaR (DUF327 family)